MVPDWKDIEKLHESSSLRITIFCNTTLLSIVIATILWSSNFLLLESISSSNLAEEGGFDFSIQQFIMGSNIVNFGSQVTKYLISEEGFDF